MLPGGAAAAPGARLLATPVAPTAPCGRLYMCAAALPRALHRTPQPGVPTTALPHWPAAPSWVEALRMMAGASRDGAVGTRAASAPGGAASFPRGTARARAPRTFTGRAAGGAWTWPPAAAPGGAVPTPGTAGTNQASTFMALGARRPAACTPAVAAPDGALRIVAAAVLAGVHPLQPPCPASATAAQVPPAAAVPWSPLPVEAEVDHTPPPSGPLVWNRW